MAERYEDPNPQTILATKLTRAKLDYSGVPFYGMIPHIPSKYVFIRKGNP